MKYADDAGVRSLFPGTKMIFATKLQGKENVTKEKLTKAERKTARGHEFLVGHDNANRTDNIHGPSSHICHRRGFLLLHFS